jgi:hypothetical protein
VNAQERYYWEERERTEEAETNNKFVFPAAYKMLKVVS